MSQGVGVFGIYVRDQDEALAFYEKVGFVVHTDLNNGHYRWLTMQYPSQPSFQLGLFLPGPPVHDEATELACRLVTQPPLRAVGRREQGAAREHAPENVLDLQ